MRAWTSAVPLIPTTGLLSMPAASQVAPLRVEDIVATHSFSEFTPVSFSPDGMQLVFAAKDNRKITVNPLEQFAPTGVPINGVGADLFVCDITPGEVPNRTGAGGTNLAPT